MVKKLKTIDPYSQEELDMSAGSLGGLVYENTPLIQTVNQLVDAVNKLETMAKNTNTVLESLVQGNNIHEKQIDELQMKVEPQKCEPQDIYAEQRKWIGKICEFWDNDDTQQLSYGVLTKIDTESGFGVQYCCNDEYDYDNCEPVKPDDDIIYKGE